MADKKIKEEHFPRFKRYEFGGYVFHTPLNLDGTLDYSYLSNVQKEPQVDYEELIYPFRDENFSNPFKDKIL